MGDNNLILSENVFANSEMVFEKLFKNSNIDEKKLTKISEEKFFKIVFDTLIDLLGEDFLNEDRKKQLIELYEERYPEKYFEIADLHSATLYELACIEYEKRIFQKKLNN